MPKTQPKKSTKKGLSSSKLIKISAIVLVAYTVAYVALDISVRTQIFATPLYWLASIPVLIGSWGISLGVMGRYTKKPIELYGSAAFLGIMLYCIAAGVFYLIDVSIIYARY